MIVVRCNEDNVIYDVHSLVKAFYPAEDVKVFAEGDKELRSDNGMPELVLFYGEKDLKIEAYVNGNLDKNLRVEGLDYSDRSEYKNALKRSLYGLMSELTGKVLPWGTLTGIRPTKIVKSMIDEGAGEEEVIKYMKEVYLCSDEKASLSATIARYENSILEKIDYENGYSLYIGIPFCPSTCLYCSFTSYPIAGYRKRVEEYIGALKKEIDYVAEAFAGKTLNTVYIGGGTPTTLEADQLRELIGYVKKKLDLSNLKEFTVEAGRADSITREKLEAL